MERRLEKTLLVRSYRGRVGIGAHMLRDRDGDVETQLKRLHAGGVTWLREDFSWLQIEPRRGAFDWTATDHFMAAAAAEGISILAIADYSAPWASSDPSGNGDQNYPPRDPQDFADYTRALAARYGTGGTFWRANPDIPAKPLAAIELWNEPYGNVFWKPGPDPAAYAVLARKAATAIHGVDPAIQVVASGDLLAFHGDRSDQWTDWLSQLLDADPRLGDVIDAWSVHPYPSPWQLGPYEKSWNPRLSFDRITQIHDILARRGAARPIWITEIGWTTASGVAGGVSESQQAEFLRQAVTRSIDDWGSYVSKVFVFSWDRASGIPTDRDTNCGLRRADDSARPAWDSLKQLLAQ